jgi:PRTRC genetic system protein E
MLGERNSMAVIKPLAALAALVQSVDLKITGTPDNITLLILPKGKEGQDPALSTPLKFSGTPEEIEEQFEALLTPNTLKRVELAEATVEANTLIEAAKKAQAEKGKAALTNKSPKKVMGKPETNTSKSTATSVFGDDDDNAGEDEAQDEVSEPVSQIAAVKPGATVPAAGSVSVDSLFG